MSSEEEEIVKDIVNYAIDNLVRKDEFLLSKDVCELSVTHKLAMYLEVYFQPNCVDIEYNKIGIKKESKRLELISSFILESDWASYNKELISDFYEISDNNFDDFNKAMKKAFNSVKKAKLVKPDIIIHKRGIVDNLLVLEVKKKSESLNNLYDIIKLHFYKRYLDYKYSAFIQYDYNNDDNTFTIYWIKDSEDELVIEYEIDEFSYESYGDKELKKLENILLNVSDFFEKNRDNLKENPEKMFVILSEILDRVSKIKHDEFAKAIEKLESIIGKIPLYKLADNLPSKHKNNRYLFLLNEVSSTALKTLGAIQSFQMNLIKDKIEEIKKDINNELNSLQRFLNEEFLSLLDIQQFLVKNMDLLNNYCIEFEIVYRNFVEPIYDLLESDDCLPNLKRKEYESNTGFCIRQVTSYLKRKKFNSLVFLIENLNAEIRNAVVHQNYYIDEESKKLVYYFLPKLPNGIRKIELQKFKMSYFKLATAKLIWFVSIGKRLGRLLKKDS